ncbi:UDP-N-acetylmuramoylalanine-D-glutamate ligase [Candidatus Omnitrophus magneticus]|uniref:UDP-N-acetylmuramoylalanine--D-glutamate ligase n=1 Tax=Candidatus Omnitrophus magneticus TaxID=1609969 RepID=A0A0F0CMR3_9BACT|nr:UDP-N-acetylmuramoylalanine-D-glutamate ligase [Candidatus Omnitrophus magneticus]
MIMSKKIIGMGNDSVSQGKRRFNYLQADCAARVLDKNFQGKQVLVIGLGRSGYASATFLKEKGVIVKCTEKEAGVKQEEYKNKLNALDIPVELGGHTREFCAGSQIAVVSPGVDLSPLLKNNILPSGIEIIGELELGFMFCSSPVIAITGTNGKSTVTELTGHVFKHSGLHTEICGNIGIPFINKAESLTDKSIAVLEVSSFQLETIKTFKPKIALLMNVTDDHYDRHINYENYKLAKFKIFENQNKNDWAVLHESFRNDPLLKKIKSRIVFYGASGVDNIAKISGEKILLSTGGSYAPVMTVSEIPIKGAHNLDNVLSVVTISGIMGVSANIIKEAVKSFKGLAHRFELVGVFNGVEYIDDSKATNIDAAKQALISSIKKVVLIAGGKDKGGDYTVIFPEIKEKVKSMVVIGETKQKLKEIFGKIVSVVEAGDMKDAVIKASKIAGTGGTVLLSPMCSSFDMFNDYKHRGKVFQDAAKSLVGKP